jgi:hypothetical protein
MMAKAREAIEPDEPAPLDAPTFAAAQMLRLLGAGKPLAKALVALGGTAAALGQALLVLLRQPASATADDTEETVH